MAGFGGLGMLVGLLFWAALIVLIVWAVTTLFGPCVEQHAGPTR
jgi:hypothetical protein